MNWRPLQTTFARFVSHFRSREVPWSIVAFGDTIVGKVSWGGVCLGTRGSSIHSKFFDLPYLSPSTFFLWCVISSFTKLLMNQPGLKLIRLMVNGTFYAWKKEKCIYARIRNSLSYLNIFLSGLILMQLICRIGVLLRCYKDHITSFTEYSTDGGMTRFLSAVLQLWGWWPPVSLL